MSYQKPVPEADPTTRPFWEGCRAGRLLVQRCTACGRHRFPPTEYCPDCQSHESAWTESSGRGTVFSWIVVRHPVPREIYADEVPYVVALIELEEGVRIASNIVDCAPGAIAADMPVGVVFEAVSPELTLPRFRPAESGGAARADGDRKN